MTAQDNTTCSNPALTVYYVIFPEIEYLPGRETTLKAIGNGHADRDIAPLSQEHIRKLYPEAKLTKFTEPNPDDDFKKRYAVLKRNDDHYRQSLVNSHRGVAQ